MVDEVEIDQVEEAVQLKEDKVDNMGWLVEKVKVPPLAKVQLDEVQIWKKAFFTNLALIPLS